MALRHVLISWLIGSQKDIIPLATEKERMIVIVTITLAEQVR